MASGVQSAAGEDVSEGLEITELDVDLIRELLEELEEKEVEDDGRVGIGCCMVQSLEAVIQPSITTMDGCDCFEKIETCIHDFDWANIVDVDAPAPFDEMTLLYAATACDDMEEKVEMGGGAAAAAAVAEYYDGVVFEDEIGYASLWHYN